MDRKVFESESYFLHVKKWLTIQTKKKDEDQPTLVTDTVLAEILAEKEKEDQKASYESQLAHIQSRHKIIEDEMSA